MLRIRFVARPGQSLGYSVERLADGRWFDFHAEARGFGSGVPRQPVQPIADTPERPGLYAANLELNPRDAPDGRYAVYVLDDAGTVIGAAEATLRDGDDEPGPDRPGWPPRDRVRFLGS